MKIKLFQLANLYLFSKFFLIYKILYYFYKTISDKSTIKLFKVIIKPNSVIVDIGANIGFYSEFFANLQNQLTKVFAFEPDLKNFQKLILLDKKFKNLNVNQLAVGDITGKTNLFISEDLNVDHQTYDNGKGRKTTVIEMTKLDDFFTKDEHIDIIKIDVQGYELQVLQGAEQILQRNFDIKIIMEVWPYGLNKAGVRPSQLLDFLETRGFKIYMLNTNTACSINSFDKFINDPDYYDNLYIFRH